MTAPIHKISCGAIQVAVWENQVEKKDGSVGAFNTVSIDRRYKDKDDNWKSSNSLKPNDIPKAILALQEAYKIVTLKASPNES